uniref:WD repeat domain 49 n=1 Tax=Scleropages formosus TaxID=113540 RepID=A0A8C9R1D0_SCLFO
FAERALAAVGRGSRKEYGRLFDSADVWREGRLDWARLASFLLLELREKEARSRATAVPRWGPLRGLPSLHRDTIQQVAALRSSSRYLSVSKEGTLGVWSDELILLKSHRVSTDSVKPRDLWVTAMAVLHNVHKVAVSFTSKEICFFDLLSKQELSCQYKVQGLRHAAVSLHYWCDPRNPDGGVLSFGDLGGQVSAICFRTAQISLFEKAGAGAGPDAVVVIKWAELVQGQHGCCYALGHRAHDGDWVRRVKFLGNLEAFVSCTTGGENSMAVAWREQEATPLRVTAARIEGGASDLDYHVGLNLIATAGLDGRVLLWNPYVVSKPVGVLQGHATGVLAVHFLSGRKQLVSFSKDQVLRVWDVHHQLCVQRVAAIFPKSRECRTLLLFHEERGRLFLTFNALLTVLEAGKEAERRVTSHAHAVTCVLYNSFLKQVISSDAGSTVTYWLVDTGQKVKQFTRCHGNAEISAMALDDTQTRLFTGGTDGLVKVWDFNGHCHHKLDAGQTRAVDILQILVLKRMVLVLGWSRTLTVFWPSSFAQCSAPSSEWTGGSTHRDHILCAAFLPPQTLVTGSYDFTSIMVWNSSTGNILRKLEPNDTPRLHCRSGQFLYPPPPTPLCLRSGIVDMRVVGSNAGILCDLPLFCGLLSGGADLVSCGGSGLVRFWNTKQGCLLAQFVAHRGSASITMTADEGGRYLVTGDMDGEVKVWDVQNYCVCPGQAAIDHAPNLLSCSRPHNDCVTHLETCSRGGRLLLLSASADCRVALGLPTGAPVGTFGQVTLRRVTHRSELRTCFSCSTSLSMSCTLGRSYQERRGLGMNDIRLPRGGERHGSLGEMLCVSPSCERKSRVLLLLLVTFLTSVCSPPPDSPGMFSSLRIEDLASVGEFTKPDFMINPHLYFGDRWDSALTPHVPCRLAAVKAAFDERSLFPRNILQLEERQGRLDHKREAQVKKNVGRRVAR